MQIEYHQKAGLLDKEDPAQNQPLQNQQSRAGVYAMLDRDHSMNSHLNNASNERNSSPMENKQFRNNLQRIKSQNKQDSIQYEDESNRPPSTSMYKNNKRVISAVRRSRNAGSMHEYDGTAGKQQQVVNYRAIYDSSQSPITNLRSHQNTNPIKDGQKSIKNVSQSMHTNEINNPYNNTNNYSYQNNNPNHYSNKNRSYYF